MNKIYKTSDIGLLIKKKRNELNMTQPQLANISGNGIRFISDLENGKKTMQIGKVLDIIHILGFDLIISARGE